ncbi:MAG: hypothetical protein HYS05_06855, partial [Acidobacteria bacterium]|nr:hypothetical protein [Acidobacteriota bacterium]
AICRDCTGGIDSLVELLQGRLSTSVMARICEPKTGLFPAPKDISFQCSCPDWASMCKHVAAVLYGIGARLDERPELLFLLRNVDQQDLIAKVDPGLRPVGKGAAAAKVLETGDLSQIFGIEIAPPAPASGGGDAPARRMGAGRAKSVHAPPRARAGGAATPTKPVPPAPAKRTAQSHPKTATRRPVWSAAERAAVTARMKAYWRDRRRRER